MKALSEAVNKRVWVKKIIHLYVSVLSYIKPKIVYFYI